MIAFLLAQIAKLKAAISSDSVSITSIGNKIKAFNLGNFTTIDALKTALLALTDNMGSLDTQMIKFVFTSNVEQFSAWDSFAGYMNIVSKAGNDLYFTCNVSSNNASLKIIGYSNGEWYIKSATLT